MIYVSMIEIFVKAKDALVNELGASQGYWLTVIGFFSGIIVIALIGKLFPESTTPYEVKGVEDMDLQPFRPLRLFCAPF